MSSTVCGSFSFQSCSHHEWMLPKEIKLVVVLETCISNYRLEGQLLKGMSLAGTTKFLPSTPGSV